MSLQGRLRGAEPLVGTWVKTPHPHVVEVLGLSPLDLLVLDAEHAPFGREALDLCLLAARAVGKAVLVRPSSAAPAAILQALDGGADGIIAPHIGSVADAEALVKACHYRPGGRGYAGSSRAAAYTTLGMERHRAQAANIAVIAQIEDADALDAIDGIAAVEGVDALFIGRADLTVSLGATSMDDPRVIAAVDRICTAARAAGRTVGMFVARLEEVPAWRDKGVTLFLLQSDQEFILAGARALAAALRADR